MLQIGSSIGMLIDQMKNRIKYKIGKMGSTKLYDNAKFDQYDKIQSDQTNFFFRSFYEAVSKIVSIVKQNV